MNTGWMYLMYAVVFLLLVLLVPPLVKRVYYSKLMTDLENGNLVLYEKHLDSFISKVTFSAFERESMRLSLYEAQKNMKKGDELIQFMTHMRLNRKQRAQLGERGFYFYLAQGKIKKAEHMIELVKEFGTSAQLEPLQIQHSILLKKEAKYIDEVKDRYEKLKDANGEIPSANVNTAGTFEYLIGLQYSYKKDEANMKEWLTKAATHLKDTPFESEILELLNGR